VCVELQASKPAPQDRPGRGTPKPNQLGGLLQFFNVRNFPYVIHANKFSGHQRITLDGKNPRLSDGRSWTRKSQEDERGYVGEALSVAGRQMAAENFSRPQRMALSMPAKFSGYIFYSDLVFQISIATEALVFLLLPYGNAMVLTV
jgi:hypothetical protein